MTLTSRSGSQMNCGECGLPLAEEDQFCGNCGTPAPWAGRPSHGPAPTAGQACATVPNGTCP
jgi:hypothetical protein